MMANELTRAERLAVAIANIRLNPGPPIETMTDEQLLADPYVVAGVALIRAALDEEREAAVALLKRVVEIGPGPEELFGQWMVKKWQPLVADIRKQIGVEDGKHD